MATLPPPMRRQLSAALRDAFPDQDAIAELVFDYLGGNLADYGGKHETPGTLIRNLVIRAESRDSVTQLVEAARAANPSNASLLAVAEGVQAPARSPQSGFEVLVDPENRPMDVAVLLARLARIEGCVGRVEYPTATGVQALGTAFLVGPDLVLTNEHVLHGFRKRGIPLAQGRVRFDYKVLPDGVQLNAGRAVSFAQAGESVLFSSPPSPLDTDPVPGSDPDPDHLDVALIQLQEKAGEEMLPSARPRGWLSAPPHPAVTPGGPLWIMQHPEGTPLKLAFASDGVERVNDNGTRLRHRVNTEPGSSGSPCFDRELALVAIHHYGEKFVAPHYNQAVPIGLVRDRLHAEGHTAALSDPLPTPPGGP